MKSAVQWYDLITISVKKSMELFTPSTYILSDLHVHMNHIEQILLWFFLYNQDKILCHHCGAIPCPADHAEKKKERLVDLNIVKEMSKGKQQLEKKVQEVSYISPFTGLSGHDKNFISLIKSLYTAKTEYMCLFNQAYEAL